MIELLQFPSPINRSRGSPRPAALLFVFVSDDQPPPPKTQQQEGSPAVMVNQSTVDSNSLHPSPSTPWLPNFSPLRSPPSATNTDGLPPTGCRKRNLRSFHPPVSSCSKLIISSATTTPPSSIADLLCLPSTCFVEDQGRSRGLNRDGRSSVCGDYDRRSNNGEGKTRISGPSIKVEAGG